MRVCVYKNLHKSRTAGRTVWSVAEATAGGNVGKLLFHTDAVELTDCTFVVKETARRRVVARKCREVHAWVVGEIVNRRPVGKDEISGLVVSYNPYRAPTFTTRDGTPVLRSGRAIFRDFAFTSDIS